MVVRALGTTASLASAMVLLPMELLAAELRPETLEAWQLYRTLTEVRIERELASEEGFLVSDFLPESDAAAVHASRSSGSIYVQKLETLNEEGAKIEVPKGLIHHWYGSVFVRGAKLEDVIAWEQDYANHQNYFDEVEASRLISREGDTFHIFLRLRRKKVITVHYATEHTVRYRHFGDDRVASTSEATRIAEIENAGTEREREKPVGDDRGFLWRLNSYWRFEAVSGGVIVECESISLSRTIPVAFRWVVKPFINSVPEESLIATLTPLRDALAITP
jgi:hypothetical protein